MAQVPSRRKAFVEAVTICLRAQPPQPQPHPQPQPQPQPQFMPDGELAPGTMVGEYRIEGKVGQGAMGVVYGAVHPVIGKRAAVKVMRPLITRGDDASQRFLQEAKAVGRLGHPNIVDAFGFGTLPDGRCYLVMEWLRGQSLGGIVRQGRLALEETVEIVDQVCRALEAAHAQGIIHRDLKPDNVFIEPAADGAEGERPLVKLLDFSVAKLTEDEGREPLTRTGVVIGTPAYVSPEQIRGAAVDGRADIYALGVMTFEMLTGRLPFNPDEKMALLHMHLAEAAPLAGSLRPEVPRELDALVARMLAKLPEHRPALREIRRVLGELRDRRLEADREPPTLEPPTLERSPARLGRQRRQVLAGAAIAAVALLFGTIALSREGEGAFQALAASTPTPIPSLLSRVPAPPPPPPAHAQNPAPPPELATPPRALAGPVELQDAGDPGPRRRYKSRSREKPKRRRVTDF